MKQNLPATTHTHTHERSFSVLGTCTSMQYNDAKRAFGLINSCFIKHNKGKFEDTKKLIRSCKWNGRQNNSQNEHGQISTMIHKTLHRKLNNNVRDELRHSGIINSFAMYSWLTWMKWVKDCCLTSNEKFSATSLRQVTFTEVMKTSPLHFALDQHA